MLKINVLWTLLMNYLLQQKGATTSNVNHRSQNEENFVFNSTHVILQSILLCGTGIVCDKSILTTLDIPNDSITLTNCPECSCSKYCVYGFDFPCCPDMFFRDGFLECRNTHVLDSIYSESFFMIASCPGGTNTDLSSNCSKLRTEVDHLQHPPVGSRETGITYLNKFCALCHNDTNYKQWGVTFQCPLAMDFNYYSSYKDIFDIAKTRSCGIRFLTSNAIICDTSNFDKIASCNVTGSWRLYDKQIDLSCRLSGYYAPIGVFKNIFCKMCNPPHYEERAVLKRCQHPSLFKNACLNQPQLEASFPHKNYFCLACYHGDNNNEFYTDVKFSYVKESYQGNLYEFTIGFEYIKEHIQQYIQKLRAMSIIQRNISSGPPIKSSTSIEMIFLPSDRYTCVPTSNDETTVLDPPTEYQTDIQYSINVTNLVYTSFALSRNGACTPWLLPSFTLPLQKNCSCTVGCTTNCCDDFAMKQKWRCISDRYPGSQNGSEKDFRAIGGCQQTSEYEDFCMGGNYSHFYHMFPVSLTRDNKETYANVFCYICGRILDGEIDNYANYIIDVRPWPLKVTCPTFVNHRHFQSLQQLISYLKEKSCEMGFQPPVNAEKCSDVCSARISSCNVSGTWNAYNEDVLKACENADVLTFHPVKSGSVVYKNRFCLICNPIETHISQNNQSCTATQNLSLIKACLQFPNIHVCSGYRNSFCEMCNDVNISKCGDVVTREISPTTTPWTTTAPPYHWSFRSSFSISAYDQPDNIPVEDKYTNCLPNQMYDSSQQSCRNLTCFPGKIPLNDKCVALLTATSDLRYTLPIKIQLIMLTFTNATVKELMMKLRSFIETTITPSIDQYVNIEDFILMTSSKCTAENIRRGELLLYLQLFFGRNVIRDNIEEQLIQFSKMSVNWTLSDDVVVNVKLSRSEDALMLPYTAWRVHKKTQCIISSNKKNCGPGVFKNVLVSPLLTCKQIELKDNEFGVTWTKLRPKFAYLGLSLSSYHFKADDTIKLRVCASDISIYKEKLKEMDLLEEGLPLSLLTLSCVCISLFFLLITFTTYCLFPSLRTLPGINNMILVFFLFLAQVLLIVRPFFHSTSMVIMSVLSHLSWLLLFFWLQVCSFHMFRVFRQDRRTENSDRYIRKTITKYLFYSLGISLLIVSSNVIISLIHSNGNSTGYDKASSLLTHKIAFIVTLILPLIFICLTNIMFFILTSYKIYSSPDIENTSRNRVQFTVYVKLFSLTGLSWLLQIVDTFAEVSILSYFVAILNGLQGFFIFLSYVCNERVWKLYKTACGNSFSVQSRKTSSLPINSSGK